MLLIFVPGTDTLNIHAIVIIVLFFLFFDAFVGEIGVNLQQRVFLDLIPSKLRNSIISFYSSLLAVMIAILYPIIGSIIEHYKLVGGLVFMEAIGIIGCIFLIPIFFSQRIRSSINSLNNK